MRSAVGAKRPSSTLVVVDWSPLLLLLLLPPMMVMTASISVDKLRTPVGQLMVHSNVKYGLVKLFTDLELQNSCTSPLINENDFPKSLMFHYESSMCTIIYNLTQELEAKTMDLPDKVGKAILDKIIEPKDMYTVWKNLSEISKSPTLNLLMEHLNDTNKWNSICCNFYGQLFSYCKFLNSEVLLLQTILPGPKLVVKSSTIKSNAEVSVSNKIDKSTNSNNTSENSKVSQVDKNITNYPTDLDTNDNRDGNNEDIDVDDPSKINDVDQFEDDQQPEIQNTTKLKIPNSIDKNQNEDLNIIVPPGIKTAQSMFSSGNKLTNHQEESHFIFYFFIMTVFSMMFYLALYNKKKIIALLIEGRRNTNHRRRPNSTSYSKVETDDGNAVY